MSFKYGDKAVHDQWGLGTVLNVYDNDRVIQFRPDVRVQGRHADTLGIHMVHPVTLTKVLSERDMVWDMYFGRYETGECVQFNATELEDALPEFREKLTADENNHYFALWFKPFGDSPVRRVEFNGDTGMTYLVTEDMLEQWLVIFKEGL